MPEYKKYPKRTEYNKDIGEGKNFLFETPNICVSVAWYGASFDGRYKITFAWRTTDKVDFPDYPFVRTKRDKDKVSKFIQSNCEHNLDIYNYHAVCLNCNIWTFGDYRKQVIEKDGERAVKQHDEWIIEKYGKVGLALRREEAGVKDE